MFACSPLPKAALVEACTSRPSPWTVMNAGRAARCETSVAQHLGPVRAILRGQVAGGRRRGGVRVKCGR